MTEQRPPGGSAGLAVVITCSTRAAGGVYPDRGGPLVVESLRRWGFDVGDPVVVPDGPDVAEALEAALAAAPDLVVTTGGTGLSPTDGTHHEQRVSGTLGEERVGPRAAVRVGAHLEIRCDQQGVTARGVEHVPGSLQRTCGLGRNAQRAPRVGEQRDPERVHDA